MRYDANGALLETEIPGLKPVHRGKVRDIYEFSFCCVLYKIHSFVWIFNRESIIF